MDTNVARILAELNELLGRQPVSISTMTVEDERAILRMSFNLFDKAFKANEIPYIPEFYLEDKNGYVFVRI